MDKVDLGELAEMGPRPTTKREAKRLACLLTGKWLLLTDTTGLSDDTPNDSLRLVQEAQRELALELMRRGGLSTPNREVSDA